MQYKVVLIDKKTNKMFEKYFENEYHLRLFKNRVVRGKKLEIIGVIKLY